MSEKYLYFISCITCGVLLLMISMSLLFTGYIQGWYLLVFAFSLLFCSTPLLVILDYRETKKEENLR